MLAVLCEVRHQRVCPSKLPIHVHSNSLHEEVIRSVVLPFRLRFPGTAGGGRCCCGCAHLATPAPCQLNVCLCAVCVFENFWLEFQAFSARILVRGLRYFIPSIFSIFETMPINDVRTAPPLDNSRSSGRATRQAQMQLCCGHALMLL